MQRFLTEDKDLGGVPTRAFLFVYPRLQTASLHTPVPGSCANSHVSAQDWNVAFNVLQPDSDRPGKTLLEASQAAS